MFLKVLMLEPGPDVLRRVEAALGGPLEVPARVTHVREVAPNKRMLCVSFRLPAGIACAQPRWSCSDACAGAHADAALMDSGGASLRACQAGSLDAPAHAGAHVGKPREGLGVSCMGVGQEGGSGRHASAGLHAEEALAESKVGKLREHVGAHIGAGEAAHSAADTPGTVWEGGTGSEGASCAAADMGHRVERALLSGVFKDADAGGTLLGDLEI